MLAPDRWLKRGWRAFALNAPAFIGGTVILVLGSVVSLLLLSVPLAMGLLDMALRARRGETPSAWDVSRGCLYVAPGLLLWVVGVVAGVTMSAFEHLPLVGGLTGLICGPVVTLFGALAALCVVDRPGTTVREAFGRVLLVVERNWLGFWAVSLLFALLAKSGVLLFGIGWLATVPWICCSWAAAYQDLFDRP
jgi:hypothetical protein